MGLEMGDRRCRWDFVERHLRRDHISSERRWTGFVRHHFLAPTEKVLSYLYHETRSTMLFLLLLPTLLLPVRRWPNPRRFALLSSPLLIPFGWFELLSNHTQIHTWMVYRTAASCFGILIAAAIIASRGEGTASNVAQQKNAG